MSIRSMSYSLLLAGLFLGLPYIYLLPTKTGVSLPVRLVVAVDKHPHHESLFASERVLLPYLCTMQNIASYSMSGKFVTFLLLCQASFLKNDSRESFLRKLRCHQFLSLSVRSFGSMAEAE